MKRTPNIRRITGITALVLWALCIAPRLFGYQLIGNVESWTLITAIVASMVYVLCLVVSHSMKHHWIKILPIIIFVVTLFVGISVCTVVYVSANMRDKEYVGHYKQYTIYLEHRDRMDYKGYVLYKRVGFVERELYVCDWLYGQDFIPEEDHNNMRNEIWNNLNDILKDTNVVDSVMSII